MVRVVLRDFDAEEVKTAEKLFSN